MKAQFKTFPELTDADLAAVMYRGGQLECTYPADSQESPLKLEPLGEAADSGRAKLSDPRGIWSPETHGLKVSRTCEIMQPQRLFGSGGIVPLNGTLGIALRWASPGTSQCGVIPFGQISRLKPNRPFPVSHVFDPGELKGTLKLQTILYLAEAGAASPGEAFLARTPGTVLGVLDRWELILEGSGSVFPISSVANPGGPLWTVFFDESAEALTDPFSEEYVEIRLNSAHPAYPLLQIESAPMESPLFREVLASALTVIAQTARELLGDDWERVMQSQDREEEKVCEPGSIAEAMYYFVTRLKWDMSSPARLAGSVRSCIESGGAGRS